MGENEPAGRPLVRLIAVAAVLGAVALAGALLLLGGGGRYEVRARFQNASQLVKGNLVRVAGRPVGEVTAIRLTDDGQAEVTLELEDDVAPLRRGTEAIIRQASLSGVANRYIALRLAPATAPEIPAGGAIEQADTTTAVDLDQLFAVFGPDERRSVRRVLRGSAAQYAGAGTGANAGWRYLNPSLVAARRLYDEVNRDTPLLERFIVSSSRLVTDLADRRDALAGSVDGLAGATGALARRRAELADSLRRLPDFMRRSNTTFVNLRATLDDLAPLVEDAKPAARRLRPFAAELRPLAAQSGPTVRRLASVARRNGARNDLVELTDGLVPLRDAAVRARQVNGREREGAFPASARALRSATPELAFARPYAVDLVGWFDDFSHTGVYDALGDAARIGLHFNNFLFQSNVLTAIPPELRGELLQQLATTGQDNRCPGSMERDPGDGSTPYRPSPDYNCDPTQVPPGR